MKKGFSLVEVMIIFALLSVILAASIPMITKKANPVPNKISHGVYRCINTGDGLLEELYSGTRKIRSNTVASCSFKVPNAPAYKVDMYSAGSGGTEYGEINSSRDEDRTSYYTMAEGLTENQNPIMLPGENELYNMFNGKYLIRSIFTGDAGDGGNATLGFESPYYARCGVDIKWYKDKIAGVEAQIKELEAKKNNYSIDKKAIIYGTKSWGGAIVQFSSKYPGDQEESLRIVNDEFDDYYFYTVLINSEGFGDVYTHNRMILLHYDKKPVYGESGKGAWNEYIGYGYRMFHKLTEAIRLALLTSTKDIDSETLSKAVNIVNHKFTDSISDAVIYSGYNIPSFGYHGDVVVDGNVYRVAKVNNIRNKILILQTPDWVNGQTPMLNGDGTWGFCSSYFSAGVWFSDVVDSILDTYESLMRAKYDSEIEELEKFKEELKKENQSDLVRENVWANSNDNSYTFENTYGTKNENYKNLAANKYVRGQVEHFCRYAFNHYFSEKGINPSDTVSFDTRYKADFGADRGRGAYSRIKYKINYSKNNGITMAQYLRNLVSTGLGGYYPVDGNGNFITQGDISSVDDGASKNCLLDKNSTYYTTQDTFNCHAGDGADRTSPKVRWRISSGNFIEVMNSLPKGGQGKHYDIAPNGITETPNYTVTKLEELYQVFSGRNYANLISENNPTTTDAVFSTATDANYTTDKVLEGKTGDIINNALSLNNDGDPILQTPRLKILSNLWKKTYRVGSHGTKGKKESFEVTNLGENCTFTVPAPGKPFRLNIDEINEEKMNKLLTTKMVCKDSSNNVVLQKDVQGTSYDPGVVTGYTHDIDYNNPGAMMESNFRWLLSCSKGGCSVTSQPQQKIADHTSWKQSSLWAKVYKKFMVDTNNNYDLSNTHKVGHAGQGTTLVDKCTVAKGKYTAQMQYLIDYFTDNDSSNPANNQDLKTGNTDFSNTQPNLQRTHSSYRYTRNYDVVKDIDKAKEETKDGFLNGYDCYGAVKDDGTGQIVIDSNSRYNKNGVITIKAGSGGGGAVVITW